MEKQPRRSIEMVSISHQSRDISSGSNREYYEESPYRNYIVISVCLLTFANGLQWVTFSSCFTNFGITYNLRTQRYRFFFIMITIAGIVLQVVFSILLELTLRYESMNPYYIAFVFYSLLNIVVIPFYTIGMNYACEITYPVGESLNGGIMMTMSQLSGISGTFFCEF